MKPMRLVIAGGREFDDYALLKSAVAEALGEHPLNQLEVVSGAARGADRLGERWARENGVALRQFPADWNQHGKRAGYLRNEEMADYADAVLVLPGGRGTDHMAQSAKRRGLRLFDYRNGSPAGVQAPGVSPFEIVASRGPGASYDVLGMRQQGKTMATVAAPGEPGWLGNPFVADDAGGRMTREEATAAFGSLVREKAKDPAWRKAFLGLKGKRVGYYKPDEPAIHLHELQRLVAEIDDGQMPEQPAAVARPTGQQAPDAVQLKMDLEGQQVQADPQRKAGDLLPWLLAAGAGGLLGYGVSELAKTEQEGW